MRWEDFRRSDNIEDDRDGGGFGGGGFGVPVGTGGLGIGAVFVLALIGWATGPKTQTTSRGLSRRICRTYSSTGNVTSR